MELGKALKSLRAITDQGSFQAVRDMLVSSENTARIEGIVQGLSEEDEFALMCRLMGTATHMVHLEQRPIIQGDYVIPDFLARFQPGCSVYERKSSDSDGVKCVIDVKSTCKDRWKIRGSQLIRRRNFAAEFGLPLFFAVKLSSRQHTCLWVIVEDHDPSSSSVEASLHHLINGARHVLWDEYWYMLRPGMYFQSVYDSAFSGAGALDERYGTQREFRIVTDEGHLALTEADAFVYSMFYTAFGLEEVRAEEHGTATCVTFVPRSATCPLAAMLRTLNSLLVDDNRDSIYDAPRVLAQADTTHGEMPVNRELTAKLARVMVDRSLLFVGAVGDRDTHLALWRKYGGRE